MATQVSLQPFVTLLAERVGLDVASIGEDEVARAIAHRLEAGVAADRTALLRRLRAEDEEWEAFASELLVSVTWFFREPTAFEQLAKVAAAAGRRWFRVLSAACATGEEPYSIAIALLEAGVPGDHVRVDAIDMSRRALEIARAGAYAPRATRFTGAERLARYFDVVAGQHRVRDEVRRLVHFAPGNLVDPQVLAGRTRYDVVFCRNVLMYLTRPAQERVLASLDQALRPDGWLFTGHAEVGSMLSPRFVSARVPKTFAFRRAAHATPPTAPAPAPTTRRPAHRAAAASPAAAPTSASPPASETGRSRVELAGRLADRGELGEARRLLLAELADAPTSADAYYWLGLVEAASNDPVAAEAAWERAAYLDPTHHAVLRHLALARRRAGDENGAALWERRAARARAKG